MRETERGLHAAWPEELRNAVGRVEGLVAALTRDLRCMAVGIASRARVHEDERSGEGGDGDVVAALAPYAPLGRGER